jgi:hypothetical protein
MDGPCGIEREIEDGDVFLARPAVASHINQDGQAQRRRRRCIVAKECVLTAILLAGNEDPRHNGGDNLPLKRRDT